MNTLAQHNKAQRLRKWLREVDLRDADISAVERRVYEALLLGEQGTRWRPTPIAPLAEPINLDELVGDLVTGAHDELRFQAGRTDSIYNALVETNNVAKAELDAIEKIVTDASSDVQEITTVQGSENKQYYWISDTFNSPLKTDLAKTTALLDPDYGMVTLGLKEFALVEAFKLGVAETNGLPGCNLLVTNSGFSGTKDKEPQVSTEGTDTRSPASILDGDPSSVFEVERNFVPPRQKLLLHGRAYAFSPSGKEEDVRAVTKDLDWRVFVQWGDTAVNQGADGKGLDIAEFVDIDQAIRGAAGAKEYAVRLVLEIVLDEPQQLTALKLTPFLRGTEPVQVESITVQAGGDWIPIARDVELGSNKSTTRLQRDVLRKTGYQSTGSIYPIPTDRDVSKIRVALWSRPEAAPKGLAHLFKDLLHWHRSERNHGLWRSADEWQEWARDPVNVTPPTLLASFDPKKLTGSTSVPGLQSKLYVGYRETKGDSGGVDVGGLAGGYNSVRQAGRVAAGIANQLGYGSAAAWLGKAVPVVGGILLAADLVSSLFSYSHDHKIKDGRMAFDVFKGHRAGIGLRDLALMRTVYEGSSTFQSTKLSFPGPVKAVGLFVEEEIPESWGQGEWIAYFISVDGETWSPLPKLTDTSLERAFVPAQPVSDVWFRAEVKGNPSDIHHTPQVKVYTLQGLPA